MDVLLAGAGAGALVGAVLLHISAHELVPASTNCLSEKHPQEQLKEFTGQLPLWDFGVGTTVVVTFFGAVVGAMARLQITAQESVPAAKNCASVKHPQEQGK